jgi:PAS domain S-box-containing protein
MCPFGARVCAIVQSTPARVGNHGPRIMTAPAPLHVSAPDWEGYRCPFRLEPCPIPLSAFSYPLVSSLKITPTAWELHGNYIAVSAALLLVAAVLTLTYFRQRAKQKKLEQALVVSRAELAKSGTILRESEERFRRMANATPVLIWMSGTDGMRTFFNEAWLHFTGLPTGSQLADGWESGVHPDDLESYHRTYAAAFGSRASFEMEYRLKRSDGTYRSVVDIGAAGFDPQNAFIGYIGSCVDITDRKNAEQSMEDFSGRLIAGQEAERTRIARDLHDDVSQRLALVGIGLGRLWKKRPEAAEDERVIIQELWDRTKELSSDVHRLSHQLHSSKLEHVGLGPALNGLCTEIGEKWGIQVDFVERGHSSQIPKDAALSLFRVAQEALTNVVKYSGVATSLVELHTDEIETRLRVVDEGAGFDPLQKRSDAGIGLVSMRERLRLVGGMFSVRSSLGRGTEITAASPLRALAKQAEAKAQSAGGKA